MAVLKKFDFGSSFLEGIEAVLKNAGTTPRYFKFLFFFAVEILFYVIKANQNIEQLDICDDSFI